VRVMFYVIPEPARPPNYLALLLRVRGRAFHAIPVCNAYLSSYSKRKEAPGQENP